MTTYTSCCARTETKMCFTEKDGDKYSLREIGNQDFALHAIKGFNFIYKKPPIFTTILISKRKNQISEKRENSFLYRSSLLKALQWKEENITRGECPNISVKMT